MCTFNEINNMQQSKVKCQIMHCVLVKFGIQNMYVCLVENSISEEITHRIKKETRACYESKNLMTSKLINRYIKM